jgi:hypothetical protein
MLDDYPNVVVVVVNDSLSNCVVICVSGMECMSCTRTDGIVSIK